MNTQKRIRGKKLGKKYELDPEIKNVESKMLTEKQKVFKEAIQLDNQQFSPYKEMCFYKVKKHWLTKIFSVTPVEETYDLKPEYFNFANMISKVFSDNQNMSYAEEEETKMGYLVCLMPEDNALYASASGGFGR